MFNWLFAKKPLPRKPVNTLPIDCRHYLEVGPPSSFTDYVPDSLVEIIISHGANQAPLDDELLEVASIIVYEANEYEESGNLEVDQYMRKGFDLVRRVLNFNKAAN